MNINLIPLSAVKEGEEAIIHFIRGGYGLIGRFASMGIAPGVCVTVLRNRGGPILILTNGTRLAIGKGQASKIMVSKTENKRYTELNDKEE